MELSSQYIWRQTIARLEKNVNYFFAYHNTEPKITVKDHLSHISTERQNELMPQMEKLGIEVDKTYPFDKLQILCLESFRNVYPDSFIDKAISIYKYIIII